MRIVLFTIDDVEFVPRLLDPFLRQRAHEVVGAYLANGVFDWPRLRRKAAFFLKNRYPFCISTGDWLRFAGAVGRARLVGINGHRSIHSYLARYGIATQRIRDINALASIAHFTALSPDLFLFAPFGQIARSPFLQIPRLGVYNVHLGKLPEHRGGLSAFWVLRFGDALAGATVHRCSSRVDEGDIVEEVRIPVGSAQSMKELMTRTVDAVAPALARAVDRIESGDWAPIDRSKRPSGYYSYPSRADFAAFYGRNCRLI